MRRHRVRFWVYVGNDGDGSSVAKFFKSKEDAEEYASQYNERFCDDIYPDYIDVDLDTGEML
jgi:hypothetical protein